MTITLLTLNIWGAPYAKHRPARIQAIAEKITRLNPDILLFQEVYLPNNRQDLISRLEDKWQYHHYFPSALIGSGLLTMSKFPIVETTFHKFRMSGKPEALKHGDYYAGKGIGLTRINTADGLIDVYNCHPHAQYEPHDDNDYAIYTDTNLYEAAHFIDSHSGASPVILAGDLNVRPDQSGYRIITQLGALVDAYQYQHQQHSLTFSSQNPYVESSDQCLDYIMLRNIGLSSITLTMNERLIGQALTYSDHYGLLAEIDLSSEKLHRYDDDVASILTDLHKRVTASVIDTESARIKSYERATLAFITLIDITLFTNLLSRISKFLARYLWRFTILTAIIFAMSQLIQATINLQNRCQILKSIQQELHIQITFKRLFDGRTWD